MKQKFLKPKHETIIRFPKTGTILPQEGLMVTLNTYWRRRISAGDVLVIEEKNIDSVSNVKNRK